MSQFFSFFSYLGYRCLSFRTAIPFWPFSSRRTSWDAENFSLILVELENSMHPPLSPRNLSPLVAVPSPGPFFQAHEILKNQHLRASLISSTHFVIFTHTPHVVCFCLRYCPAFSVLIVIITSFMCSPWSHSSTRTHQVPIIHALVTESLFLSYSSALSSVRHSCSYLVPIKFASCPQST